MPIASSIGPRNASLTRRRDSATGRTYETPDGVFPSVTSILGCIAKPALVNWAAKVEREYVMEAAADLYDDLSPVAPKMKRLVFMDTLSRRMGTVKAHEKVKARAGEIGSSVHALIEWNLRTELGQKVGPEPRLEGDEAMHSFAEYEAWRADNEVVPLAIEQVVWHTHDRYAGTLDLLARVNGKVAVVDYKTSKGLYDEYDLQISAYGVALNWMGHGPAECGYIVRLPKTAKDGFEVKEVEQFSEHYPTFLHAVALHRWQVERRKEYEARTAA